MEIRTLSAYGDLSKEAYEQMEQRRVSLEMYHKLWRNRVLNLLNEKASLETVPGYQRWFLYRLYGLTDVEFTRGCRYLAWLTVQTNNYVKYYRKLKTEVNLLKLQHGNRN